MSAATQTQAAAAGSAGGGLGKQDFAPDTRCTLAWRDERGRARPLNVYVYRAYDGFMVARETSGAGLVRKIAYSDVVRVVHTQTVPPAARYFLPAAVLDEKNWRDRTSMQHYATAPGLGK
ncbi:MAG: hypothetical protein M5U08_17025 [Burkholderiales bacterium]|nr:hypothetical protein [Burkholderiales bacterium]